MAAPDVRRAAIGYFLARRVEAGLCRRGELMYDRA